MIAAIKRLPGLGMISIFAYLLIISLSGSVYDNGMGFYWNNVSFCEFAKSSSSVIFWIARVGTAVLGIVASFHIFDLLLKFKTVRKMSFLGTTTLGVYILHQDILSLVIKPILLPHPILVVIVAVLLFVLCHFIIMASKKVSLINTLLWELPRKVIGA